MVDAGSLIDGTLYKSKSMSVTQILHFLYVTFRFKKPSSTPKQKDVASVLSYLQRDNDYCLSNWRECEKLKLFSRNFTMAMDLSALKAEIQTCKYTSFMTKES